MATRKQLRDEIKAIVATAYPGTIYTSRRINAEPPAEFISITIPAGEIEGEGLIPLVSARCVISVHSAGATDDDLDAIADPVYYALKPNQLPSAAGLTLAEFRYGDDEDKSYEKIHLIYNLYYHQE